VTEVRAEADDGARRPRGGGSHGHGDARGSGEKQQRMRGWPRLPFVETRARGGGRSHDADHGRRLRLRG